MVRSARSTAASVAEGVLWIDRGTAPRRQPAAEKRHDGGERNRERDDAVVHGEPGKLREPSGGQGADGANAGPGESQPAHQADRRHDETLAEHWPHELAPARA